MHTHIASRTSVFQVLSRHFDNPILNVLFKEEDDSNHIKSAKPRFQYIPSPPSTCRPVSSLHHAIIAVLIVVHSKHRLFPKIMDVRAEDFLWLPYLRWPGDSQREPGRFARINPRKSIPKQKNHKFEQFARIASNLQFAILALQFGNPEPIREDQAIRANLRIDSCESGHLSPLCSDRSGWRNNLQNANVCRTFQPLGLKFTLFIFPDSLNVVFRAFHARVRLCQDSVHCRSQLRPHRNSYN